MSKQDLETQEPITTSSAIEVYEDYGIDLDGFSDEQVARVVDFSNELVAIARSGDTDTSLARRATGAAALLLTASLAEVIPVIVDSDEASDHTDLQDEVRRLLLLGVTDVEPFTEEESPIRFDSTDDELGEALNIVKGISQRATKQQKLSENLYGDEVPAIVDHEVEFEGIFDIDEDIDDDDEADNKENAEDAVVIGNTEF